MGETAARPARIRRSAVLPVESACGLSPKLLSVCALGAAIALSVAGPAAGQAITPQVAADDATPLSSAGDQLASVAPAATAPVAPVSNPPSASSSEPSAAPSADVARAQEVVETASARVPTTPKAPAQGDGGSAASPAGTGSLVAIGGAAPKEEAAQAPITEAVPNVQTPPNRKQADFVASKVEEERPEAFAAPSVKSPRDAGAALPGAGDELTSTVARVADTVSDLRDSSVLPSGEPPAGPSSPELRRAPEQAAETLTALAATTAETVGDVGPGGEVRSPDGPVAATSTIREATAPIEEGAPITALAEPVQSVLQPPDPPDRGQPADARKADARALAEPVQSVVQPPDPPDRGQPADVPLAVPISDAGSGTEAASGLAPATAASETEPVQPGTAAPPADADAPAGTESAPAGSSFAPGGTTAAATPAESPAADGRDSARSAAPAPARAAETSAGKAGSPPVSTQPSSIGPAGVLGDAAAFQTPPGPSVTPATVPPSPIEPLEPSAPPARQPTSPTGMAAPGSSFDFPVASLFSAAAPAEISGAFSALVSVGSIPDVPSDPEPLAPGSAAGAGSPAPGGLLLPLVLLAALTLAAPAAARSRLLLALAGLRPLAIVSPLERPG